MCLVAGGFNVALEPHRERVSAGDETAGSEHLLSEKARDELGSMVHRKQSSHEGKGYFSVECVRFECPQYIAH